MGQNARRCMCAPYFQREIVSCRYRCIGAAKRCDASCAHGVASAASSHAAHQPIARMLPLRRPVAHAANHVVGIARLPRCLRLRATAADNRRQGVSFRALRRVVHGFGAHAAVFIQPLDGEVDGRGQRFNCTCVAHVEVACVASDASALIFNARATQRTLAESILIPKISTGVTCGALDCDYLFWICGSSSRLSNFITSTEGFFCRGPVMCLSHNGNMIGRSIRNCMLGHEENEAILL
jgi:hypothetical protein